MPKFIYTIFVIIILNSLAIYYVLTQTSPESLTSKIVLCLLLIFFISFIYPLYVTLFRKFLKTKEELNVIFKTEFKKIFTISIFLGIWYFLKLNQTISNTLFVSLVLITLGVKLYLSKYKNSKKRVKY